MFLFLLFYFCRHTLAIVTFWRLCAFLVVRTVLFSSLRVERLSDFLISSQNWREWAAPLLLTARIIHPWIHNAQVVSHSLFLFFKSPVSFLFWRTFPTVTLGLSLSLLFQWSECVCLYQSHTQRERDRQSLPVIIAGTSRRRWWSERRNYENIKKIVNRSGEKGKDLNFLLPCNTTLFLRIGHNKKEIPPVEQRMEDDFQLCSDQNCACLCFPNLPPGPFTIIVDDDDQQLYQHLFSFSIIID